MIEPDVVARAVIEATAIVFAIRWLRIDWMAVAIAGLVAMWGLMLAWWAIAE